MLGWLVGCAVGWLRSWLGWMDRLVGWVGWPRRVSTFSRRLVWFGLIGLVSSVEYFNVIKSLSSVSSVSSLADLADLVSSLVYWLPVCNAFVLFVLVWCCVTIITGLFSRFARLSASA